MSSDKGVTITTHEPNGKPPMPTENPGSGHAAAPLARRVGSGADASQVAAAAVAIWQEIDKALSPIIGQGGGAALFSRSLALTMATYPWLAVGQPGLPSNIDSSALKAALEQQLTADAKAGADALFQSFYELFASLVGASLTERLLGNVWANSSSASPTRDNSS